MSGLPEASPPGRRDGFWIRTFSGGRFYPLDPREREIRAEDFAHALSNLCRFTGHVREFYSVAQHCLGVSLWVEEEAHRQGLGLLAEERLALEGLLHDASEGYLNDVATPVKRQPALAGYRAAEERLQRVIARKYGLPEIETPLVKRGDQVLLVTEARDLLVGGLEGFGQYDVEPLRDRIDPMSPREAERAFLDRFDLLGGER